MYIVFRWETHDWTMGTDRADYIWGGWGNDTLLGGLGDDQIYGGDGDDFLYGGSGFDTLHGGNGHDRLDAGPGGGRVTGGAGADVFIVGSLVGSDVLAITDFLPWEGDVLRFDGPASLVGIDMAAGGGFALRFVAYEVDPLG